MTYNTETYDYDFARALDAIVQADAAQRQVGEAALAITQWLVGCYPSLLNRDRSTAALDGAERGLSNLTGMLGSCRAMLGDVRAEVSFSTQFVVSHLVDEANRLVKLGFSNHVAVDRSLCEFSGLREPEESNPLGL